GHVLHSSRTGAAGALPLLLFSFSAAIGLADCVWAQEAGFAVTGRAYGELALAAGLFFGAGYIYARWRPEPRLAAMLTGTGFLIGFTAAASVLNAMLVTVAGHRIDAVLARADLALGFHWLQMMQAVAGHPGLLWVLQLAYGVLLPEIALAVIVLGTLGRIASLYRFVLAVAIGALISILIWTLVPSFGAMSVYALDPTTIAKLHVVTDGAYGQALVRMLHDGPGLIAPDEIKGMIGFPSYHAVLALLLVWYFRYVRWLRWPVLALNVIVIAATPIEGGHHWLDVFAAIPVAVLAIVAARRTYTLAARLDRSWGLPDSRAEQASSAI
ncbi:MAG: phosphatase PAP2 family protein, partial [Rhizomicrobium sp.]